MRSQHVQLAVVCVQLAVCIILVGLSILLLLLSTNLSLSTHPLWTVAGVNDDSYRLSSLISQ